MRHCSFRSCEDCTGEASGLGRHGIRTDPQLLTDEVPRGLRNRFTRPGAPKGRGPRREMGRSIHEKVGFGSLISVKHFRGTYRSPSRPRAPVGLDRRWPNAQA